MRAQSHLTPNDLEGAMLVTPPDMEWTSGIGSVQAHEIRNLTVKTMGKQHKGGHREGEKGQGDGEETAEEDDGLSSSYCTMCVASVSPLGVTDR